MVPTLYVTRPGVLRIENNCFVADAKGRESVSVPAFRVDSVVVFGPVQITHAAISKLLAKRACAHFLSRLGAPKGTLIPSADSRVEVRVAQYRAFCDERIRLEVARAIVAAKILNSRRLVMRFGRNHPVRELAEVSKGLLESARDARKAASLDTLRGIEGAAAARYFRAFALMVGDSELFNGRSRRPPRDPANALLSLGYTLLGGEIAGVLLAQGMDPGLGFYHQFRRGMPALAQDVLEEFRTAVVDRLVLSLLNTRVFDKNDFTGGKQGGLRLKSMPLKEFLTRYEKRLEEQFRQRDGSTASFRKLIIQQAGLIRKTCSGGINYEPFDWERG